jgi:hypothetical protein
MTRYDRGYDFGMRGYRQTTRPLGGNRPRRSGYDPSFYMSDPYSDPGYPLPNRVTASYNRDYVDNARSYDRDYGFFGGDHPDRMGDESFYRRPYSTVGGTRTMRGTYGPPWTDPVAYGPPYGDRFRDDRQPRRRRDR